MTYPATFDIWMFYSVLLLAMNLVCNSSMVLKASENCKSWKLPVIVALIAHEFH